MLKKGRIGHWISQIQTFGVANSEKKSYYPSNFVIQNHNLCLKFTPKNGSIFSVLQSAGSVDGKIKEEVSIATEEAGTTDVGNGRKTRVSGKE